MVYSMYTYCIHTTNVVAVPLALLLGLRLVLLLGGKLCLGGRLRLLPGMYSCQHMNPVKHSGKQ